MEIKLKEIDGVKYVPAKSMYNMWNQLSKKIDAWEKCADGLIIYAKVIQETVRTESTKHYRSICNDIYKYNKLKSYEN